MWFKLVRNSMLAALFVLPAISRAAERSATDPVLLTLEESGEKCLAYPLEVPAGDQDAVITVSACARNGLTLSLKDGKSASPLAVHNEAGLGIVRFPSGTVTKAVVSNAKAKIGYLPGSPILTDGGEIQGLVSECKAGTETRCEALDLRKPEVKAVLSELNENIWGEQNAAVSGDAHQKRCRLFGGRGGGFHYHGGYSSHVSITIVVVVVYVQPSYYHHHHHCHSGGCDNSAYERGYRAGRESCQQGQESPAPAQCYTPPPRPAYVGVYDPAAGADSFAFTSQTEKDVANNTGALLAARKPTERALASSIPSSLVEDRSALYAANLEGRKLQDSSHSQWAMNRPVNKPELLVANPLKVVKPELITLVMR